MSSPKMPPCVIHGRSTMERERDITEFCVEDKHKGALQCLRCRRYTCDVCINKFTRLLCTRLKSVSKHLKCQQVFTDMSEYLLDIKNGGSPIQQFSGSGPCCTILEVSTVDNEDIVFDRDDAKYYDCASNDEEDTDDENTPELTSGPMETSQPSVNDPITATTSVATPLHNKRKRSHLSQHKSRSIMKERIEDSRRSPTLAGALHVDAYHVLLHAPIGTPCTHAMGDQRKYGEKGPTHGAVTDQVSESITKEEFDAAEKKINVLRSYGTECNIKRTDGESVKRKTWWTELGLDRNVVTKKHCNPSRDRVLRSSFIPVPDGYDTHAILGEPLIEEAAFHLLQLTFLEKTGMPQLSGVEMDALYSNLMGRAGRRGMEAARSGGSQGMCKFDAMMRKHLRNPGAFPRHINGMMVVIVNSPQRCGYFGIYSDPYDVNGNLKMWFYHTPRCGGHQRLLPHQLKAFPVLKQFPSCRVETAQLLMYRNKLSRVRPACPDAAAGMMEELKMALAEKVYKKNKESLGFYLARNCRITLLAHPVGYHKDVFSDDSGDKIENKILLVSYSRSNTKLLKALGRGGAGHGVFVFALLDWNVESRARRRDYVALGGDIEVRVTQRVMDEFLIAHGDPGPWRYIREVEL